MTATPTLHGFPQQTLRDVRWLTISGAILYFQLKRNGLTHTWQHVSTIATVTNARLDKRKVDEQTLNSNNLPNVAQTRL